MKKVNIDESLRLLLKKNKIPILILDTRWHSLFSNDEKPSIIRQLEEQLQELLKEQGRLVNEKKDLTYAKKELMNSIVASMGKTSERKAQKSKDLILEINERLEENAERTMDLPDLIRKKNHQLLVTGTEICYERMRLRKEELEELDEEINMIREVLKSKVAYKVYLEEESDRVYTTLHDIAGPKVMQMFDEDNHVEKGGL